VIGVMIGNRSPGTELAAGLFRLGVSATPIAVDIGVGRSRIASRVR
jgi:hypothetical protein